MRRRRPDAWIIEALHRQRHDIGRYLAFGRWHAVRASISRCPCESRAIKSMESAMRQQELIPATGSAAATMLIRFARLAMCVAVGTLAACATPPQHVGQIERLIEPAPNAGPPMVNTDATQVQREADISAQVLRDQAAADQQAAALRAAEIERQRIANAWAWSPYPAPYMVSPYWAAPVMGWGGHINYGFGGHGHWRGGVWIGF